MFDALSRERIVAEPGFDRWSVPPASLAIHLSIGQVYAISVFKLPLTRVLGARAGQSGSVAGDWTQAQIAWIFTIAIVFLGLSAALFGRWLEGAGPRKSGLLAAALWASGFFISALGVHLHRIELLYVGYGGLGGCGLGIGYITPVSTLIKWFPDRRGMATGMAIMGFGGGAMIGSPLSQALMDRFRTPTSTGVAESFMTLGAIYFAVMVAGALSFRVPPPGWTNAAAAARRSAEAPAPPAADVRVEEAVRMVPFYFLWAVLFLNVTAGIGILEQASPMVQEVFSGRVTAAAASGFVGLLSLLNMLGRFLWSSASDRIGRKRTYAIFFSLGCTLFIVLPACGRGGSVPLFVACAGLIMTMYGGGFATIPAYLSDLFGTTHVGAIHGRLLTAWSCAGVAGPVLVNYLRQHQLAKGVPPAHAYDLCLHLMAGLLALGFVMNLAVHTAPQKRQTRGERPTGSAGQIAALPTVHPAVVLGWIAAGLPLLWGVWMTLKKAALLLG